jgi:multidrug resistance protein MdtO
MRKPGPASTPRLQRVFTALSAIGSSHQKQALRIAGAIAGGIVMGIGAQVFILPALDSIAGFTLLFISVTIIVSWLATSTPRISYFGVQAAIAFLSHQSE